MKPPPDAAKTRSGRAAVLTRRRLLLAGAGGLGTVLVSGPAIDRLAPPMAPSPGHGFEPAAALPMEEEPLPHDVHLADVQIVVPTPPAPAPVLAPPQVPPPASAPAPFASAAATATAVTLPATSPPAPPAATAAAPASPVAPPVPAAPRGGDAAWLRHAEPFVDTGRMPAVAIVVDDLGLGAAATRRAIALDGVVTLAMMTYAPRLAEWSGAARAARHEILVHVPMQPLNGKIDAGPKALTVALPPAEILDRLRWGLGRLDGYIGINNHMGSRFTQDRAGMAVVMEEVKARGLLFLDSVTIAHTVGAATAAPLRVPFAERNVFLDDQPTVAGVARQIAVLEQVARRHGTAIAIGHPHPATLGVLAQWLPGAAARGIAVVPLTSVVRRQAMGA